MNEIISLVSARRGVDEDEIARKHSFEQILLKRHFDVREDKRVIDYEATLTAGKIAQLLADAFGG